MPSDVLVDVKDLVKTYGPLRAVDGLTFQVRGGEVVGLLGANGAGKSTLMKVLTCYLVADGGSAHIAGISIDKDPVAVRRHIGYLPENAPLYTEMRVKDFLEFAATLRGVAKAKRRERIEWAVESCGLTPKYMADIGTLSRGFRQRVGIAQAILHDPDLLILDEPTSGLDPIQIIEIRRLIMDIGKTKTVFFSTHIMQEVEAVCSRAIIISKGKLVADGSPAELKAGASDRAQIIAKLRGVEKEAAQKVFAAVEGIRAVEIVPQPDQGLLACALQLHQNGKDLGPAEVNRISSAVYTAAQQEGWPVQELHSEGVSLEDVFMKASSSQHLEASKQETEKETRP